MLVEIQKKKKKKKKKLQELDHVIKNINNRKKIFKTDSEWERQNLIHDFLYLVPEAKLFHPWSETELRERERDLSFLLRWLLSFLSSPPSSSTSVILDESRAQAAVLGYEQHMIMRRGLLAADQRVHLTSKLSLLSHTKVFHNLCCCCWCCCCWCTFFSFSFSFFPFSELLEFHHM